MKKILILSITALMILAVSVFSLAHWAEKTENSAYSVKLNTNPELTNFTQLVSEGYLIADTIYLNPQKSKFSVIFQTNPQSGKARDGEFCDTEFAEDCRFNQDSNLYCDNYNKTVIINDFEKYCSDDGENCLVYDLQSDVTNPVLGCPINGGTSTENFKYAPNNSLFLIYTDEKGEKQIKGLTTSSDRVKLFEYLKETSKELQLINTDFAKSAVFRN